MKAEQTEKTLRSQYGALLREQALQGGWYGRAKVQVHRTEKNYSRKKKHKKAYDLN